MGLSGTVSFHHQVIQVLLILKAHVVDEIRIKLDVLIEVNAPRFRIGLGIVDRQIDFQPSKIRPADALGDLRRIRNRIAQNIEPDAVAEALGVYHQRLNNRSNRAEDPGAEDARR